MNYTGVIIEESLRDTSILGDVTIVSTKVEEVTERHKTPWLKKWTLHSVEVAEDKAEEVAQKLSRVFETEHTAWYADFKNDKYHFIIFPEKIFKVDLQNPVFYKDAKAYGLSLGIPEYQVDFTSEY